MAIFSTGANITSTAQIADNAVATADIAALAVTPAKIAFGNEADVLTTVAGAAVWAPPTVSAAGVMTMFAGAAAPSGWLLCDGASLLRATYATLFTAIGIVFGAADGTHFNVPDMRGRVPAGVGTGIGGGVAGTGLPVGGSALTALALADWKGEETHVLTTAELAAHAHNITLLATGTGGLAIVRSTTTGTPSTVSTESAGSNTAHNNIQPVMGLNFIIKT